MKDYNEVADYFKKIAEDESERLAEERATKEKIERENIEKEQIIAKQSQSPFVAQNEFDDIVDGEFNIPSEENTQSSMSYADVDEYFRKQVEEAEREKQSAAIHANNKNRAQFDNNQNIAASYSTQQQSYAQYDAAEQINRQPLDDGTAYRPILDEIIANSQKSAVVPENLKTKKLPTVTAENIALMQNLESGLSILKTELKNQNYNLRPYTKFNSSVTYYANSHIFTSRIRFESSIYTALVMLLEIFAAFFIVNSFFPQKILYYYIAAGVLGLIIIMSSSLSLITLNHKRLDRYSFKTSTLTALVIIFPAIVLIVLYALFIKKIDVTQLLQWVYTVIYPVIISVNLLVYVVMYNLVYKSKRHHLK